MEPDKGRLDHSAHTLPVRIYFEDTDAGGIAYHASFLRFMERGRTELLRAHGYHQSDRLHGPDAVAFVVRRLTVEYISPARLDDVLTVVTRPKELRAATVVLEQEVRRGDEMLVSATVQVAAVRQGRAVRIPDEFRPALTPPSA